MYQRSVLAILLVSLLVVSSTGVLTAAAQVYTELLARARLFPEVGPGFRALRRCPEGRAPGNSQTRPQETLPDRYEQSSAGRYYVLTMPGAVQVYNVQGQRVGQIPAARPSASKDTALFYGDDLDVDSAGRVYVADRGANAVKVFNPDGTLALAVLVAAPSSVTALTDGEFAVSSMKSPRFLFVFDAHGKLVREFGEPSEIAERAELNRFLNIGRLATDAAGHIYYAFTYLPEPTVRKYDRHGYAVLETKLTTLDFQPAAQAARREIQRQERGGTPTLKPIISALGVEPASQEIWIALGGILVHFDSQGNRRGTYRTFTPEGARLEAIAIVVEPDRLLLGADPLGIYEFPRPDKTRP